MHIYQFHHLRPARLSSYSDQINEMIIASNPITEKAECQKSGKKIRVTKKNKTYPAFKTENVHWPIEILVLFIIRLICMTTQNTATNRYNHASINGNVWNKNAKSLNIINHPYSKIISWQKSFLLHFCTIELQTRSKAVLALSCKNIK